jgi:hypothetical protein
MSADKKQTTQRAISYTPGPYSYCQSSDGCDDFWDIVAPGVEHRIGSVLFWDDDEQWAARAEANARLFAAAPELLDSLRLADIFTTATAGTTYNASETRRRVCAAIAKAGAVVRPDIAEIIATEGVADQADSLEEPSESLDYFGRCPMRLRNDGYLSIRRAHWFRCRRHWTKWFGGKNLFSS